MPTMPTAHVIPGDGWILRIHGHGQHKDEIDPEGNDHSHCFYDEPVIAWHFDEVGEVRALVFIRDKGPKWVNPENESYWVRHPQQDRSCQHYSEDDDI